MQTYKLGLKAPKRDDRTLRFARYLAPSLPAPPSSCDWGQKLTAIGMMNNDRFGCCGPAALAHAKQVRTCANGSEVTVSDADVLAAYVAITREQGQQSRPPYDPFNPTTGANDNGVNELDMLKQYRSEGFYGDKLDAFAAVTPSSQREVMDAIYLMGGCLLGVALPLAWQGADEWTVPSHIGFFQRHQYAPGGWGGHAIIAYKYDSTGVWVLSWGEPIFFSWAAFVEYTQEAYVMYNQSDWLSKAGLAPNGVDAASLMTDVAQISRGG
jgi:hypothetical protein